MSKPRNPTGADLNALADGELDSQRSESLLAAMEYDPHLQAELCEVHRIKDLVRHAHALEADTPAATPRRLGLGNAVAAMLLLVGGFTGGWLLAPRPSAMPGFAMDQVTAHSNRVILYLGESNPAKFRKTLGKAEALLQRYREAGIQVTIVTSAGGVDLLRASTTPFGNEIRRLAQRYASLQFVACNNTIYHMRQEGKQVELLDEADTAPSAVAYVVDHLREGWRYIAI